LRLAACLPLLLVAVAAVPAVQPLSAYVGKYPFNKVGGYKFITHPTVRSAVDDAVFNKSVKAAVLSDGVAGPIRKQGSLILTWSCEPHNCGSHNWSIAIVGPKGPAAVCYHDEDLMGDMSAWFLGGVRKFGARGGCPAEMSDVPPNLASLLDLH
jgi:hypothetical protein